MVFASSSDNRLTVALIFPSSISAHAALGRRTVHVRDVQADPEYAYVLRDVEPIHTVLSVPIIKGDDLVGTITI
jgi:GAF domain-containing protein